MSTKNYLKLNSTNLTTLPLKTSQSVKEVNTIKRSFNVLFGGIALGWIICMTILITFTIQS